MRKILAHREILSYRYSESAGNLKSAVEVQMIVGTTSHQFQVVTESSLGPNLNQHTAVVSLETSNSLKNYRKL